MGDRDVGIGHSCEVIARFTSYPPMAPHSWLTNTLFPHFATHK